MSLPLHTNIFSVIIILWEWKNSETRRRAPGFYKRNGIPEKVEFSAGAGLLNQSQVLIGKE